ncbi:MAG: hypothetical protein H0T65_02770 [Deltaproteobacteria bacterium]|nr:hypothetical protein [Deltaproteobacteria bacterium]
MLSRELVLVRHNAAWTRFAQANDGLEMLDRFGRGCSIMSAVPPVLQPFYKRGYAQVWTSGERWEHDYECSSPDRHRRFRMLAYPIDHAFLVVVNAVIEDVAHDREVSSPDESRYVSDGVISMCSNCRRVRNRDGESRWDWVPAFVAHPPPNLSHGICDACAPIYYGSDDWDA